MDFASEKWVLGTFLNFRFSNAWITRYSNVNDQAFLGRSINPNNIRPSVLNEAIVPDGEIPQNLDLLVLRRDVGVSSICSFWLGVKQLYPRFFQK